MNKLNPLQQDLLAMLKWLHAFCTENNVMYYSAFGTMLGAIRHNGFIPWDDDVDVYMPRPDYQKFKKICICKPDERYILECPESEAADYRYPTPKLYDSYTLLTESARINCRRGVYIDIFPLDGVGNTAREAKKNHLKVKSLDYLRCIKACSVRPQRSAYKNAAIALGNLIPDALIDDKKLAIRIAQSWKEGDYDRSRYVSLLCGSYGSKDIIEKRILGIPTLYPFEDTMIYGPQLFEEYLSQIYGDWRQLPPMDKRVGVRHDFVEFSLEESFLK